MFQVRNSTIAVEPAPGPLTPYLRQRTDTGEAILFMQSDRENENPFSGDLNPAHPRRRRRAFRDEGVTLFSGERRSRRRYPLDLEVTYKVMRKYQVCQTGTGKTIDMSGNGIAFETKGELELGAWIELSIAWPMLLNDTCALKLVVTGRVVRSSASRTAIRLQGYEFRTKGSGMPPTPAAASSLAN